ncbi:unnamed protein product [Calicophoron daubneyi]|uniref:Uncharacterized protein n=1 Tax=Calicophoron daubneyi TaxID=300641 RepID=A0AAV2TM84_CALDB
MCKRRSGTHPMDEDVFDLILCGEERAYNLAYKDALSNTLKEADRDQWPFPSRANAADPDQLSRAWELGVQHGAQLASELCSYLGMVQEISKIRSLEEREQQDLDPKLTKRKEAIFKVSDALNRLLTQSPGLLILDSEGSVNLRLNQQTLDQDLENIRSKAKHLESLLQIHMVTESVGQLSF